MALENEVAQRIEEWWSQVYRATEVSSGDFFPGLCKPESWQESATGLFKPPELVAIERLTPVTLAQTLSLTDPLTTAGAVTEMVMHNDGPRAETVSSMMILIAPDTEQIFRHYLGPVATQHLLRGER